MINDNKQKMDELSKENFELRREMAELRSVVFSMLQQICTDMMCQNREFDREKCPYYETIFKQAREAGETKEYNEDTLHEEE